MSPDTQYGHCHQMNHWPRGSSETSKKVWSLAWGQGLLGDEGGRQTFEGWYGWVPILRGGAAGCCR